MLITVHLHTLTQEKAILNRRANLNIRKLLVELQRIENEFSFMIYIILLVFPKLEETNKTKF